MEIQDLQEKVLSLLAGSEYKVLDVWPYDDANVAVELNGNRVAFVYMYHGDECLKVHVANLPYKEIINSEDCNYEIHALSVPFNNEVTPKMVVDLIAKAFSQFENAPV